MTGARANRDYLAKGFADFLRAPRGPFGVLRIRYYLLYIIFEPGIIIFTHQRFVIRAIYIRRIWERMDADFSGDNLGHRIRLCGERSHSSGRRSHLCGDPAFC